VGAPPPPGSTAALAGCVKLSGLSLAKSQSSYYHALTLSSPLCHTYNHSEFQMPQCRRDCGHEGAGCVGACLLGIPPPPRHTPTAANSDSY
jgi:hypothetical protein